MAFVENIVNRKENMFNVTLNQKISDDARDLALEYHGMQTYGNLPYSYHLDSVYNVIVDACIHDRSLSIWKEVLSDAAYLHDVLEDTNCKPQLIENIFGVTVRAIVEFVTDPFAPNRKVRKNLLIKRFLNTPTGDIFRYLATAVKLADRIANVEHCIGINSPLIHMYKDEMPEFLSLRIIGENEYFWKRLESLFV